MISQKSMIRVISLDLQLNFHLLLKQYLKEAPILINDAIKLRPINPLKDAEAFYQLSKEISLDYWAYMNPILTIDEAAAYLLGCRDNNKIMVWAIELLDHQDWIGIVWLMPENEGTQGDIRVRILQPYQKAYFNQIMNLIVQFSFHELSLTRLHTKQWKKNIYAVNALKQYGFKEIEEKEIYSEKYAIVEKVGVFTLNRGLRLVK